MTEKKLCNEPHIRVSGAQRAKVTTIGLDASPGLSEFMAGWKGELVIDRAGESEETAPTPQEATAKPVAWLYESCARNAEWQLCVRRLKPPAAPFRRNVRPLYEHPSVPAAPVTTPEVEAARRKALKVILTYLEREKYTSDLYGVRLALGVLRDLAGQPRRYPDTRIGNYDETPVGQVPEKGPEQPVPLTWGVDIAQHAADASAYSLWAQAQHKTAPPARLSVEDVALIVAGNGATRVEITNVWVKRIAEAVHEAVYGKDA